MSWLNRNNWTPSFVHLKRNRSSVWWLTPPERQTPNTRMWIVNVMIIIKYRQLPRAVCNFRQRLFPSVAHNTFVSHCVEFTFCFSWIIQFGPAICPLPSLVSVHWIARGKQKFVFNIRSICRFHFVTSKRRWCRNRHIQNIMNANRRLSFGIMVLLSGRIVNRSIYKMRQMSATLDRRRHQLIRIMKSFLFFFFISISRSLISRMCLHFFSLTFRCSFR